MKLSLQFLLLLLAFLLPVTTSAYDFYVDEIEYTITSSTDKTVEVSGYRYFGSVTIPATVTYNGTIYSVTSIGNYAFYECSDLTSVTIPNSVTSIGYEAFSGCSGLTSVTIPNSVTSIGSSAFSGCSGLTSVTIGNSVTSIGGGAFYGCSGLASVIIPNSVTSIGNYAFSGCNGLTSVTIGNSVTSIGNDAFYGCVALDTLNFNAANCADFSYYESEEWPYETPNYRPFNDLNISTINVGVSVQRIPANFARNLTNLTSATIGNSVTSIGYEAFSGCSGLTSVTIPNSVTSIGSSAFSGCSGLTSVTIGNSVTSIGDGAFSGCSGLTSVFITNLQAWCGISFSGSSSNPLSYAHRLYLNGSEVTDLVIPNSVTSIGYEAFSGCSGLTSVTIPNSVTSIGGRAFSGCSGLTSVTIGNSVTSIGDGAFYDCSGLTSVIIPNSVTSIGYKAFSGCSGLTSVIIPNSVTSIGYEAFSGCSGLTSVTIPNSVTSIGGRAFSGCSGLTSVTIPNSVTSIGSSAFSGCSGLTSVTIPNSVISIGDYVFSGCSGLTSVTIGNSVTSIGSNAFDGCVALDTLNFNAANCADFSYSTSFKNSNISTINIGSSVERIPAYFAYGLTELTSITIPNSVTSIGYDAFSRCSGLTSVTIGSSVTSIGSSAFKDCTGLTRVDISNLSAWCSLNCQSANSNPLYYAQHLYLENNELTDLVVPDEVEAIGDYTFYNCNLSSIRISKSVTAVGKQAFNNSPTIETVTCAATIPPSWNDLDMFTTNVYNHAPLYVPIGSERAYMADQCWGQFATIIGKEITTEVLATGISLNQSQMSLQIGDNSQLVASVMPDSTINKVVTWMSSDASIANVDTTGMVTAIAPGKATITATTTDGSNLCATCVVTVTEDLSNYDNYLSLSDTEAFHGDTIVIPVAMVNAENIIAFQTDIFLPEGIEIVQEDGDYLIDPSSRMTHTHSVLSNDVASGAVRVICYSSNYKPFTGNSGEDLFYFTVKVADDAEGDYIILISNTMLTNSDFEEITAPDVSANMHVKSYLLGDANGSGTVTVTDVVVTSQYVLEMNPQPFVFEAADVNFDNNITVTDVSRIAWMVLNPTLGAPRRAPALWNNGDRMSGEGITLMPGETRTVSIALDNAMDYSSFQFDLNLPEGLTASNFRLADRALGHAFDVNMLANGKTRALCYSPMLTAIHGNEGALLTFDVTVTTAIDDAILVDGIELVTTDFRTVILDDFAIGVNNATAVNEIAGGKTIARVDYFNLAGQRIDRPESGVTLKVITYTDGTRITTKLFK